ncbi:MAG: aminotransferase class IV, partial [Verrucomicrobiales bacterium]
MSDASSPSHVWLNGQIVPTHEARIDPFDHGFLTGDGVFETLIVKQGKPFALTRHWERLGRSTAVLSLEPPSKDVLSKAIEELLAVTGTTSGRLRITVTGGTAPLGSEKGDSSSTVLVAVGSLPPHGPEASLVTVPFRRNEHGALTNHKTISYGENVVALAHAKKQGGTEAIFANTAGGLCEGTGGNLFLVYEDELITPPISSGCLPGVTRALVLELCKRAGITVSQRNVPLRALAEASEAFLTSTLREVQPVRTVDGSELAQCPGKIGAQLHEAYLKLT